jgi:excisionase family DNA binding protein
VKLLDQREAAQILKISVRTLERHRAAGTGPRFLRLGRLVRYRASDLEEWIAHSLHSSTSDALLIRLLNQSADARH